MTHRLKVLQVATLVSPDSAYGGPVRVAFNQSAQLRAQGAEVTVGAGVAGFARIPERIDDVPVWLAKARSLLPGLGFSGLVAPKLLWRMVARRASFDVVHVHLARDLVTLPAAALAIALRKRLVVQTHGMVVETDHPVAPVLDKLLTRPVLRRAAAVFYLTDEEAASLRGIEPTATLIRLPNGVPLPELEPPVREGAPLEVLFLARLHTRKRPMVFVEAAGVLTAAGIPASFRLVGPDEGEADAVQAEIARLGLSAEVIGWEGPLPPDQTQERMRQCSVYALPSINEPFPMSVLEAMALGKPVVITRSCGLADIIESSCSGIVVGEHPEEFIEALRTLLSDAEQREAMGQAARQAAAELFSMPAVAGQLEDIYRDHGSSG